MKLGREMKLCDPTNIGMFNSLGPVIILRNGMRKEITSSECESEALRNTLNRVIVAVKKTVLLTAFQAAFHGSALLLSAFLDVWMSWRPSSRAVPGLELTALVPCAFWK